MDRARAAVEALQEQKHKAEGKPSTPTADLPFGRDSKRIFESAAEVGALFSELLRDMSGSLHKRCKICQQGMLACPWSWHLDASC